MAKSYRDLLIWQKGIQLSLLIYRLTKDFPREETYGLTSQMRRAAVSIPTNIAEGCGRLKTGEYMHFLGIARASNCELQTLMIIARELGLLDEQQYSNADALSDEIGKMITATVQKLRSDVSPVAADLQPTAGRYPLTTNH